MRADVAKLVYSNHTRQYHVIAYGNVACKRAIIGENAIISHNAVVRDVAVCLNQAIFADYGFPFVLCPPVDGDTLPDGRIVADFGRGFLAVKLQILWDAGNDGAREYAAVFADPRSVHNGYVGPDPCAFVDHDIFMDGDKRLDDDIAGNFGLWVYIC